jgi:type VI secretion system protein ImpJ
MENMPTSRRLHKLIWSEGMYLAPHHFQAQSRFFEDSVHFVTDSFRQFNYGFHSLEIDANALKDGTFLIHGASGLMPDGMVFELSKPDQLPAARTLDEIFPDTGQPLMLFLAIPSYQEGQQNVMDKESNGRGPARFQPFSAEATDLNTGQDLKALKLLKQNFRFATEKEIGSGDVRLPIARVVRDGKGQYLADPSYAPPCVQVAASSRLTFLTERLIEILSEKSRNLSARRKAAPGQAVRGDPKELVEFWLLHSINSAIPALRMWKTGKSLHPAQLFLALSQLAGALCTFAPNSDPMSLPDYDHNALGDCFGILDNHIQRHLELGLPTNCIQIPLERYQQLYFRGAIADPRCFGKARWVLAVKGDLPETTLISQGPGLVKVSAADWIERVVRQAVPGAPLTYASIPPASVPAEFGAVHFIIDSSHRLFDPVRTLKNIGVYVPGEIRNPEVELYVVLGENRA